MLFLLASQALLSALYFRHWQRCGLFFKLRKKKEHSFLMAFIVLRLGVWSVTAGDIGD